MGNNQMYDIVGINLIPGGFGEYQTSGANTGSPIDLADFLMDYSEGKMFVLGHEDTPKDIPDIRGLIRNQPDVVIAILDENDYVTYYGANKLDERP